MTTGPVCPYCGSASVLRDPTEIYGDTAQGRANLWVCTGYPGCDSYVATRHGDPLARPAGTMASPHLRRLRARIHAVLRDIGTAEKLTQRKRYMVLKAVCGHVEIGTMTPDQAQDAILKLQERQKEKRIANKKANMQTSLSA